VPDRETRFSLWTGRRGSPPPRRYVLLGSGICDFIGKRLQLAQPHSLRTYLLAAERKSAGLDWQQYVLSRMVTGTLLVVANLKGQRRFW